MKLKKTCALILSLAMAFSLVACGSGDSGNSSNSGGSDNSTPDKVYTLTVSMHDGSQTLKGRYMQEWADNLREETNGALDITVIAGGALASADTVVEAMETGACDIAMVYTTYYDALFTLTNGVALPMLGIGSAQQATEVMWDMYEQSPEMKAEFDNYIPIHVYSNGPSYFHFVKNPVNTFDGISGLKLRSGGGSMTDFITACGGAPMNITTSELYEALEKGLVDGNVCNGSQMSSWNLAEVESYFMDMPLFVGVWMTLMNKESFEKLPAELQDAIMNSGGREGSLKLATYLQDENDEGYEDAIANNGGQWISVAEEEQAKFAAAAEAYNQSWIESHTTADFDAQNYYDMLMVSAAQHAE